MPTNDTRTRRSKKAGLPPGSLVLVGKRRMKKVEISLVDYDETTFEEREISQLDECIPYKHSPTVTWINVNGLHNIDTIKLLGDCFEIHPLVQEDIVDTEQRPKLEDLEQYMYLVGKTLSHHGKNNEIVTRQVSIILGQNFILTFQEDLENDIFRTVRDRIKNGQTKIKKMGPDYLVYTLLDVIVDNYFTVLEELGEKIEYLEEKVVSDPTRTTLKVIHKLKQEIIFLRKSIWPLREVISGLERRESALIKRSTGIYLRDVYDHTIQIIDTVETYRDIVSGMLEIYLSSASNRLNEVMKVLTIIATIFMPLTFIVGVYGMNFRRMPELDWPWGYSLIWTVMIGVGLTMFIYFKRKRWL